MKEKHRAARLKEENIVLLVPKYRPEGTEFRKENILLFA